MDQQSQHRLYIRLKDRQERLWWEHMTGEKLKGDDEISDTDQALLKEWSAERGIKLAKLKRRSTDKEAT